MDMTSNMHAIEQTYVSLLTDVGYLSGIPTISGAAYEGLQWCVNDAPLLDKQLLAHIEIGSDFDHSWPKWLLPLRDRFCRTRNACDLRLLRQLLVFCYKAEHIFTDETKQKAIDSWLQCNSDVGSYSGGLVSAQPRLVAKCRKHCTSVLSRGRWDEIIPSHGPGAVYDNKRQKGDWSKWFTTIEACYPYGEFFGLSKFSHFDYTDGCHEISDDIVARLIAVPKDARGPRLICVHPAESIWIQQGLRRELERCIDEYRSLRYTRVWPRGHIHFDDQTVNGQLAQKASYGGYYATLDLKEASDRLSERLVQELFGRYYRWFGCCRASHVDTAPNRRVPAHSYAPMGNATTFPVQSLVFWSICVATLEDLGFHQPWDCYVFGDDIIVPSACAEAIMLSLETFGLVVNHNKSFYRGAFRESCGVEAYNGYDITPLRWKTSYNADRLLDLQSISDLAQRLRQRGYMTCSTELYSILRDKVRCNFGRELAVTNNPDHGGIAEYLDNSYFCFHDAYWHRDLHMYVSPILRLSARRLSEQHGWHHVLSSLTSLERSGLSNDPSCTLSRGARLERGWTRLL